MTGAQPHDSRAFDTFLNWKVPPSANVADKAYGSAAIRQSIADEGAVAVIPSKSNARVAIPHAPELYAKRNLVERFFCQMKGMRRLTTRYEKLKKLTLYAPYLRNQMLAKLSTGPIFLFSVLGAILSPSRRRSVARFRAASVGR